MIRVLNVLMAAATLQAGAAPPVQFRPALVGTNSQSVASVLPDEIQPLAGDPPVTVGFRCAIDGTGKVLWGTVHGSKRAEPKYEAAVRATLAKAHFEPAIYGNTQQPVYVVGLIAFSSEKNQPVARIFLNRDKQEIANRSDFVAPQILLNTFRQPEYPYRARRNHVNAEVDFKCVVEADGTAHDFQIVKDTEQSYRFGPSVLKAFKAVKFIPAFRDGKPVRAEHSETVLFIMAK